jgi:sRNA-binding carbon storage regulator CsrA
MLVLTRYANQATYFSDQQENEVVVTVDRVTPKQVDLSITFENNNSEGILKEYKVTLRLYEQYTIKVRDANYRMQEYRVELVGFSDTANGVRLGFTAPSHVKILRNELDKR